MATFDFKNYDVGLNCARVIDRQKGDIALTFAEIDKRVNVFLNEEYISTGSEEIRNRYSEIAKNYELFQKNLEDLKRTLDNSIARYEESDKNASSSITDEMYRR